MGEGRVVTAFYLDSSVAVRAVLGEERPARWLDETSAMPGITFVTSRITRTEITRVLRREGIPVTRRDALIAGVALVPVTDYILAAAEAIESPIKTLDAIHLASAMATGLDPIVVTHDRTMARVAIDLGYAVADPCEP